MGTFLTLCLIPGTYSFYRGCEPDYPCSDGVSCGNHHKDEQCNTGTETDIKHETECSFKECNLHAKLRNSFAFAYRDRGKSNRYCWLCDENAFANPVSRSNWGIYVRDNSTGSYEITAQIEILAKIKYTKIIVNCLL